MRGHVFLSTSCYVPGIRRALPERFYWKFKRRLTTNPVGIEGEGLYSEDPEPCQSMDGESERGQRDIPEPCHITYETCMYS